MPQTVESEILAELERAELAARERRLAAQAEADRIVEEARLTAERVRAGVDARIAAELEAFREQTLDEARHDVAAIEVALEELNGGPSVRAEPGLDSAERSAFEAAVADVVAAVLGESATED